MLDFTDLQNEVVEYWGDSGVEYLDYHFITGSNIPPGGYTESSIKPHCEAILDDPIACINELGFNKISQYIVFKSQEAKC